MTVAMLTAPAAIYFLPDMLTLLGNMIPAYSNRKVGGIRFIKIGRINLSFSISKPKA